MQINPDKRDTETVPIGEYVEGYFAREVLPHCPDAWIDHSRTRLHCEINTRKYFFKPYVSPAGSLADISRELMRLQLESSKAFADLFAGDALLFGIHESPITSLNASDEDVDTYWAVFEGDPTSTKPQALFAVVGDAEAYCHSRRQGTVMPDRFQTRLFGSWRLERTWLRTQRGCTQDV